MMKRHDDSQRSDRRAVTQPMHAPPPPQLGGEDDTERTLGARGVNPGEPG